MSPQEDLVKCLIWDLDNTLWRGTLLEDPEVHVADEIRRVVVELDRRGVLQSVVSRNDHEHAWQRLEELAVAEYFVLPRIGWGRKSDAVRAIVAELGFAESTVAFVDDQPFERAEVSRSLPRIRCYPAERAASLTGLPEFSPATVTADATRRRAMYQARVRREADRAAFRGPDEEFLKSLGMELVVARAGPGDLARVEELTRRTSQLNATGIPYSRETLDALVADPAHEVLVATLADRFGPHGAVGVILLERLAAAWRIKLLATSCRVVACGVGSVLLRRIVDAAARANVHLLADFRRTERNRMMEIAYRFAGLEHAECACHAGTGSPGEVQRLHLVPAPQPPETTMRVTAAGLTPRANS
ncbi:HAD-IIIC family phosphatase [Amycolatopsis sp. OK19-0408]|uniref:HAD-IIIC family phosphatase n=1 Tax=Amycolatopsis iheyensis TaxID=2945988 RepID=A0A9X2NGS6_9PSEU|nr:HAD-IIIC family phosphatase [Amycolatopsis iheyensis]MCR6488429.1 HAD-IIIC family phosphatase [Amycolatopsis iheyensis]